MNTNRSNLAGEFYAMFRLFLAGFEATLTLGNTKGVDILLLNPNNNKTFKVEVKTRSSKATNSKVFGLNYQWIMDENHEQCASDDLVFCFVNLYETSQPKIFIVPSKNVAEQVAATHKKWLKETNKPEGHVNTMRMFMIPASGQSEYQDNFKAFE